MILPGKSDKGRTNALLIATIACRSRQPVPFHSEKENISYAHLCSLCAEAGMDLYITHFDNVLSGSRIFSWICKDGSWETKKLHIPQVLLSYADLPPNEPNANVLREHLIDHQVTIVNDLQLSDCLTDKVSTYKMFPEFIPPSVDTGDRDIAARLREMSKHSDLSLEKLFLKPRFGERGKGIEVINFSDLALESVKKKRDYIVQPFLESDAGIPELNIKGRHDLRMLVFNGNIVQVFVRIPAPNSYVSNYAMGGKLVYYETNQVPKKCREVAFIVDERLKHYVPRFYTIDVGIGKSGKVWVYELNTMPGIVWEVGDIMDKTRNIVLHKVITEMLKSCLR